MSACIKPGSPFASVGASASSLSSLRMVSLPSVDDPVLPKSPEVSKSAKPPPVTAHLGQGEVGEGGAPRWSALRGHHHESVRALDPDPKAAAHSRHSSSP